MQLVVRHRDAVGGARAGQPDEVLGADVRSEDRGADDPPAEVTAGEEIVLGGGLVLPDDAPRDPPEQAEVGGDSIQAQVKERMKGID